MQAAGNPLFAVEALAVGGALKAVASAIDNYIFKKSKLQKLNNFLFWLDTAHLWGCARLQGKEQLMDYCTAD